MGTMPVGMMSGYKGEAAMMEGLLDGAITELPAVAGYGPRHGARSSAGGTGLDAMTAAEREALLMEHLPTVRYLARRIHERLPQHVELDDLVSAGVVGWMDAFSKFDHNKKVQLKR